MHKYGGDQGATNFYGWWRKKALHEEYQNSLPNDFEKDEETSHEKE